MGDAKRRRDNLIGQRLREILDETGIKAIELARALDVSSSAISQTLGGGGMTPENVFRAADYTGYEARWLATGKGPKKRVGNAPTAPQADPASMQVVAAIGDWLASADRTTREEMLRMLRLPGGPYGSAGQNVAEGLRSKPEGAQNNESSTDATPGEKRRPPSLGRR